MTFNTHGDHLIAGKRVSADQILSATGQRRGPSNTPAGFGRAGSQEACAAHMLPLSLNRSHAHAKSGPVLLENHRR